MSDLLWYMYVIADSVAILIDGHQWAKTVPLVCLQVPYCQSTTDSVEVQEQ